MLSFARHYCRIPILYHCHHCHYYYTLLIGYSDISSCTISPCTHIPHLILNRASSFLSTRSDNDQEIESESEYSDHFDVSEVEDGSVVKKRLVRRGSHNERSYAEEVEESQLGISTVSVPDELEVGTHTPSQSASYTTSICQSHILSICHEHLP